MNPQTNPTALPSLLEVISSSLSAQAGTILVQAFERKQISTGEIADLLVPHARKGPAFSNALRNLTQVFREHGVEVTYSVIKNPSKEKKEGWKDTKLEDKIIPLEPIVSRIVERVRNPLVDEKVVTSFMADLSTQRSEDEGKYHAEAILSMYFREIGQYPLLTVEQEREFGTLSFDKKDKSARNRLMVHNLRLVISIARKYQFRGVCLADLIQEGNLGLLKAAEKFNPHLGYKFSTYAQWWIRQAITRAIDEQGNIVRKPVYVLEKRRIIYRKVMQLVKTLGRMPTDEEVLKETGYHGGVDGAIALVRATHHVSIDAPLNESDPGFRFGDTLADANDRPVDLLMDVRVKFEAVAKDLRELTVSVQSLKISERNQEAFLKYYGLNGNPPQATLESVASTLNLTRERVRQIIAKIWEKLEDNKVEYDDVILMNTLKELSQLEMLVGENADLTPRETDESLLLEPASNVEPVVSSDNAQKVLTTNETESSIPALSRDLVSVMVVNLVGKKTSVSPHLMLGIEKKRHIVEARHIAMYLLREDFRRSGKDIAALFGNSDHGPAWRAHKDIRDSLASGQGPAILVEKIRAEYTLDIYPNVNSIGRNQTKLFAGQRAKGDEMLADCRRKVGQLTEVLETISVPDRARDIFRARYGLAEKLAPGKTLEEVGQTLDITRERVRQILTSVWEKLIRPNVEIKNDSDLTDTLEQIEILEKLISAS